MSACEFFKSSTLRGDYNPNSTSHRNIKVEDEPSFHSKESCTKTTLEHKPNKDKAGSKEKEEFTVKTPKSRSQPAVKEQAKNSPLSESKSQSTTELIARTDRSQNTSATEANLPNSSSTSATEANLPNSSSTSATEVNLPNSSSLRPSKFGEAYKKYRELQTLTEHCPRSGKKKLVSVKERAQFFGQK